MTGSIPRDPTTDHLLTPANAALLVIDYQPKQVASVSSGDRNRMVDSVVALIQAATLFDLPIVLSTVNVATTGDTIPAVQAVLPGVPSIDRTTINAWEDPEFNAAVKTVNRRKLLLAALWTEACLLFPALDALREGYEVYPVVDAVGGTSLEAHEWALQRMIQAGARPTTWNSVACELQRDWARAATAPRFADLLAEHVAPFGAGAALRPDPQPHDQATLAPPR